MSFWALSKSFISSPHETTKLRASIPRNGEKIKRIPNLKDIKQNLTQSVERVRRLLELSILPTDSRSDLSRFMVCCFMGEVMSMRLYLVQHGEAKSEAEDPERSLTVRGETETRKISGATKKLGIRPSRIYHSGKKRAEQTAGIIARALDLSAQLGQGLNPNDDVRPWVERISREAEDLMIVGHLPFLEKLASFLVCGDEGAKAVLFRYSAILCLEKKEPKRWAVGWVLKPEMV
jgi:phosphohistidine phosphatase